MKKITILGVIFILLAVLVVPAMAKSPHGNNNQGNSGNGNTPVVSTGDKNQGNSQGQDEQNQRGNGNQGNKGKGNGGQGNPNKSPMSNPFYLQGTIKSIDTAKKTIVVTVVHGNARVKQFIGTDITLTITDTTQIFKIDQMDENGPESGESSTPPQTSTGTAPNDDEVGGNRVPITFEQLAVGDIVAVHGSLIDNVYTARLITVYVRAPEGEPEGESDSQG